MEAAREYVDFWPRVLASVIDFILLFIVMSFIGMLVGILVGILLALSYLQPLFDNPIPEMEQLILMKLIAYLVVYLACFIVSVIVSFFYYLILWSKKQATIGKMAIHAIIIDAKTGGKPTTGQFIGRYFALILSALPLGAGFIWVAFDEQKRGWHDILAGTLVVKQNYYERSRV
jgi:uncharacterized RDD family membrane protein YckC